MTNNIQIQFVKLPVSETLSTYINQKSEPLFKEYPWLIKAQVCIKKDAKNGDAQCICDMELSMPGPRVFSSSYEPSFEIAVKNTISELHHQLERVKHKMVTQRDKNILCY
ncbi:HPF/RaiA family ribosome-associated protein [Spongiivirga citrea]|uniref:30S ribosomal protein S30 n=1 Tax=Spongiivirga citrea TaxID=1481457 RepID=A0A6M0CJI2_9FLAO|nr:HPF/RaiA family ribosome-associated protein [Spongiivirga citrea]NER17762.1 30S ribosomal protein S30 [Spongiivirga citrea]